MVTSLEPAKIGATKAGEGSKLYHVIISRPSSAATGVRDGARAVGIKQALWFLAAITRRSGQPSAAFRSTDVQSLFRGLAALRDAVRRLPLAQLFQRAAQPVKVEIHDRRS